MTVRPYLAFVRLVSLGLLAATLSAAPASAQGFFDSLFGGGDRANTYAPRHGNSYAPSWGDDRYGAQPAAPQASGGTGRAVAYCVRLCDGRFFPMQRQANATSIQLCNAFCPAAKTQVFNGSEIGHAVASSGTRYADLANAFVYRQKVIPDCTCNGKDAFGLAKIDVANDPTLKPGDIVSSGDNVKVALTAMMAAKERREASTSERTEKTGSISRRVASRPASRPAAVVPGDAPSSDADERPED